MSTTQDRLVIALSSRALFDLNESQEQGHPSQTSHENSILNPGVAFNLIQKLLALNTAQQRYIEIVLLSKNNADTGLKVFNSIGHYQLDISRAAFTRGAPLSRYLTAFGAHLFLSADINDVRHVLADGHAAATVFSNSELDRNDSEQLLRIAFDGDAMLFSNQDASHNQSGGSFKKFLAMLHHLQSSYPEDALPIRTALLTARAVPAHEGVVQTLRDWKVRIDEAYFLGGLNKVDFLRMFGADIFFDDQLGQTEAIAQPKPAPLASKPAPAPQPSVQPSVQQENIEFTLDNPNLPTFSSARQTEDRLRNSQEPARQQQYDHLSSFKEPVLHEDKPSIQNSFDNDPLLTTLPTSSLPSGNHFSDPFPQQEEPSHIPVSREMMPIVDGSAPKPTVPSSLEENTKEKVWLFDEHPAGHAHDGPTHQPLPTPRTNQPSVNQHSTAPSQNYQFDANPNDYHTAQTHKQEEPEAILSTEEILRRFARKMTENVHVPSPAPTTQNPTIATSSPAPVSQPNPNQAPHAEQSQNFNQKTSANYSAHDPFQDMMVEEISYEPVKPEPSKPRPADPFFDPLQPNPVPNDRKPAQPQGFGSQNSQHPSQNKDSASSPNKPSMPNPFALMKDFKD